jgi:hypothetical protein
MKRQSSRGTRERVEAARRQAQLALGKDPDTPDDRAAPSEQRANARPSAPTPVAHSTAVGVLLIGEAASRLRMDRAELEAMIARDDVETLPTQFVRVVPTCEVERLQRSRP